MPLHDRSAAWQLRASRSAGVSMRVYCRQALEITATLGFLDLGLRRRLKSCETAAVSSCRVTAQKLSICAVGPRSLPHRRLETASAVVDMPPTFCRRTLKHLGKAGSLRFPAAESSNRVLLPGGKT